MRRRDIDHVTVLVPGVDFIPEIPEDRASLQKGAVREGNRAAVVEERDQDGQKILYARPGDDLIGGAENVPFFPDILNIFTAAAGLMIIKAAAVIDSLLPADKNKE